MYSLTKLEGCLFKMNMDEIVSTLQASYQQPLNGRKQRRIVFWFDQGKEFMDYIEGIPLDDDVRVHILTVSNSFFLKYLLEDKDITSHFLIYCDLEIFWCYVSEKRYGFNDYPKSFMALYIYLTISALSHSSDVKFLTTVKKDAAEHHEPNSSFFIDRWMHHETDYLIYDKLAESIEREIKLANRVPKLSIPRAADSFPYFDKMIILNIANSLEKKLEDYTDYIKLINFRRVKHAHKKYHNIYEALFCTVKIFEFYKKHNLAIQQDQGLDMYHAYVEEYNKMDTYYSKFYAAFDKETNSGIMNKLKSMVENLAQG
jgi:hypothetical protein